MITIQPDGSVQVDNAGVKKFLQRHHGRWRVTSTIPRLLVLQQLDFEGTGNPRALLSGSVERPGWLIEIINFITNSRLSGDLVTVSKGIQRELVFEKGALRVAFSTAQADLLGEFILSERILSKEQLDKALKSQTSDKRLGQVLVDLGLLSGPQVYQILQHKTERIFYDTIGVGEGLYHFITEFGPLKLPASMYMDTQALLMEGVKRIDDLEHYNQTVPVREASLAVTPGPLDGYSDTERRFLEVIDGRRTLAGVDAVMRLGVDEMLTLTHRLVDKGVIRICSARQMEEQNLRSVVDSFNQALEMILSSPPDPSMRGDLVRAGREFIASGSHNNRTLSKLAPGPDGSLTLENIRAIYAEATERDRVKLIVMVLTQYISYMLFNAMERLPIDRQEPLSAKVNDSLSAIFASNL